MKIFTEMISSIQQQVLPQLFDWVLDVPLQSIRYPHQVPVLNSKHVCPIYLWEKCVNGFIFSSQIYHISMLYVPFSSPIWKFTLNISPPATEVKNLKPLTIHHFQNNLSPTQWWNNKKVLRGLPFQNLKPDLCNGSPMLFLCTILFLSQADQC